MGSVIGLLHMHPNLRSAQVVGVLDDLQHTMKWVNVELFGALLGTLQNVAHHPWRFPMQAAKLVESGASEVQGKRVVDVRVILAGLPEQCCGVAPTQRVW